ncbi:MAG TPA: hypothetical protein VJ975_07735 [Candidatus Limnocylindria bacterium]|nr:hypothetical protein [Candidatus Limnocylindria bacterium]
MVLDAPAFVAWLGSDDGPQASYAALASLSDMPLVSDDPELLGHGRSVARPVDAW